MDPNATLAAINTDSVIASAARSAYVLGWASAEEEAGRSLSGEKLEDVAPAETPVRFRAWASEAWGAALFHLAKDPRRSEILDAWKDVAPADLGHALAMSVGGWDDGFGGQSIPAPATLPLLDCDVRLCVDAEELDA